MEKTNQEDLFSRGLMKMSPTNKEHQVEIDAGDAYCVLCD